jgi:hypothetical protein
LKPSLATLKILVSKCLSQLNKKALSEYSTGVLVTPDTTYFSGQLEIQSSYFPKEKNAQKKEFQKLLFNISRNKNELKISFDSIRKFEFSRSLVKKNRDMLKTNIVFNIIVTHVDSGKRKQTVLEPFSLYLDIPNFGKPVLTKDENPFFVKILPVSTKQIYISCNIKEVNPYYTDPISSVVFLENYGESLAEVISGTFIEQEED